MAIHIQAAYAGRHGPAMQRMIDRYGLTLQSRVLDVGCARGFTLVEFIHQGITVVYGCDLFEKLRYTGDYYFKTF